jgi:hypothetical protein
MARCSTSTQREVLHRHHPPRQWRPRLVREVFVDNRPSDFHGRTRRRQQARCGRVQGLFQACERVAAHSEPPSWEATDRSTSGHVVV